MMINKINHTITSSPSLTSCRQSASYSTKSDVIVARRKQMELRRLKVLSGESECFIKRGHFVNTDNDNDKDKDKDKDSKHGHFPYHSSVIGRRREMEDAVSVELGFVKKYDFYGVYDGHGGSRVAHVCSERLFKLLGEEMERRVEMDWEKVMVESFVKMDEEVSESEFVGSMGSTAVIAVVGDDEIVVGNCGDSRAVLSRGVVAVPLSNDHKPDRPDELQRIEHSGGRVVNWNGNRVLGVLATSRSIGDRQLNPYVIAKPEVIVNKRNDEDEFLILASDGLWDVMSNDLACHVVTKCLDGRICGRRSQQMNDTMKENKYRMTDAAVVLTELAMARGSKDNISVIVVNLKK